MNAFKFCAKLFVLFVSLNSKWLFFLPQQAASNFAPFTVWRGIAQNEARVPLLLFTAGQQFGSAQDKSKSFTSGFWAGVEGCAAAESQSESSNDQ